VVFVHQQGQRLLGLGVVAGLQFLVGNLQPRVVFQVQLDQRHDAVVDDAHEL
jgi:hypothetical protein